MSTLHLLIITNEFFCWGGSFFLPWIQKTKGNQEKSEE